MTGKARCRKCSLESSRKNHGYVSHGASFLAFGVRGFARSSLEGSEEDLRQQILTDPNGLEEGFVAQMTERETAAEAIDIYGKDVNEIPTIVKLKRHRVGPDAVSQMNRYVNALRRELPVERPVRGILVASSVTDRAERLLAEQGLEFTG